MFRRTAAAAAVIALGLSAGARAQVKLEFKQVPGTTSSKTVQKLQQSLTINGNVLDTSTERSATTTRVVGTPAADGSVKVVDTIDALKIDLGLPGGIDIAFDSANPDAKPDNPMLAPIIDSFKVIAKSTFTLVFDKAGKLTGVESVKPGGDLAALSPAVADQIKAEFDPKKVQKETARELDLFPAVGLKKGDTWTKDDIMQLGQGQSMTFKRTYTYLGPVTEGGKSLEKIDSKATAVDYKVDAGSPIKVPKSMLEIKSSAGTIFFDPKLGTIAKRDEKVNVVGTIDLEVMGMEFKDSKLDLTIETSTAQVK